MATQEVYGFSNGIGLFPYAFEEHFGRVHSDHCTILLRHGGVPLENSAHSYRCQNAWTTHNCFKDVVMYNLNCFYKQKSIFNNSIRGAETHIQKKETHRPRPM